MSTHDEIITILKATHLYVATPMFGGLCTDVYCASLMELTRFFTEQQFKMEAHFQPGESLIPRARNLLADHFLRSAATHLLFIDADIQFSVPDVVALLGLATPESPYDVISGIYPLKHIYPTGAKYRYVFNRLDGALRPPPDEPTHVPVEMLNVGNGFMLIRRSTFERLLKGVPRYRPDTPDGPYANTVGAYFDTSIVNEKYVPEDYHFCNLVRQAGGHIWIAPWVKLVHVGVHHYGA